MFFFDFLLNSIFLYAILKSHAVQLYWYSFGRKMLVYTACTVFHTFEQLHFQLVTFKICVLIDINFVFSKLDSSFLRLVLLTL